MRVLHFVTGGFSGATNMVIDLISAHQQAEAVESLLVLRQKKTTTPAKLSILQDKNIAYQLVTGRTHIETILALKNLCLEWQPDIMVCHGFPEHIIGRWAGKTANVPHLVQVEHSSKERYTHWRLWQSRFLSQYTACVVGVSEGVVDTLKQQNLHAKNMLAIANGIDSDRFVCNENIALAQRPKDIIMVGRFAKDKDHGTLLQALSLLKKQGIQPRVSLVGDGKNLNNMKHLAKQLELDQQVTFLGRSNQVPQLLKQHKVCVLSSLREGMSLSVLEGMASGCVTVGTRIAGVAELIANGKDGFLFEVADAGKLADILTNILANPSDFNDMAVQGRAKVIRHYDKKNMSDAYLELFISLHTTEKPA